MHSQTQQLKNNLQQQTKRLLDQLKELDENKADLTEEQYNEMKQQTLDQLKTFQNSLNHLLADPNNSMLQSQIEKTKRAIFQAFKSQFNKEQVVDKLLCEQAKGTRNKILAIQHKFHTKTINEAEYVAGKRKLIVQIQQIGAKLTAEQAQWLKLHHHFEQGSHHEVKDQITKNQVKLAQKKLQNNI